MISEKIWDDYFNMFNVRIFDVPGCGGTWYTRYIETPDYKKDLAEYESELEKAHQELSDDEISKWRIEHYPPVPIEERRNIPSNEHWEEVGKLIIDSIELNKDLLWERYKDNIIDDDGNIY